MGQTQGEGRFPTLISGYDFLEGPWWRKPDWPG